MGWLFGGKKVPKVPFPEGRPFDERTLRLPGKLSAQRVIGPEEIKAAAGLGTVPSFPEEEEESPLPPAQKPPLYGRPASLFPTAGPSPLFIKMEVYRRVLMEIDEAKSRISELGQANKALDKSEYNEEHNFVRLRRSIKGMHDRLLLIDKIVFKT